MLPFGRGFESGPGPKFFQFLSSSFLALSMYEGLSIQRQLFCSFLVSIYILNNPVVSVRNPSQLIYSKTLLFPYEIRCNLFIQKLCCFRTKSAKIAFGMDNYGTLVFPEQVAADFVRKQQGKSLIDELLGYSTLYIK